MRLPLTGGSSHMRSSIRRGVKLCNRHQTSSKACSLRRVRKQQLHPKANPHHRLGQARNAMDKATVTALHRYRCGANPRQQYFFRVSVTAGSPVRTDVSQDAQAHISPRNITPPLSMIAIIKYFRAWHFGAINFDRLRKARPNPLKQASTICACCRQ